MKDKEFMEELKNCPYCKSKDNLKILIDEKSKTLACVNYTLFCTKHTDMKVYSSIDLENLKNYWNDKVTFKPMGKGNEFKLFRWKTEK